MSAKIGRNDPCHCGSGRKYKHCHLRLDEQRLPSPQEGPLPVQQLEPEAPLAQPDPAGTPSSPGEMLKLLRDMSRRGSKDLKALSKEMLARLEPMAAYDEQREQIVAASDRLQEHRAEFRALSADQEAYFKRCEVLFQDERFAPLRFTGPEVVRAFEKVGYPSDIAGDNEWVKTVSAAILYLADKDRREDLATRLLLHLPQIVAEGRFLDGWIIRMCAQRTEMESNESNPFLLQMFSCGYDAWREEKRSKKAAILRDMGVDMDRFKEMSLEEIEAWVKQQQADPEAQARFEARLKAHPELHAAAVADCQQTEREFSKLLKREDARSLLLQPQELEPALPLLINRLERERQARPDLFSDDTQPPRQEMADITWSIVGEMAQSLFTADRVDELASQLRQYRNERFAAGDKEVAFCAQSAINSLESQKDPAQNYILLYLCHASLRALLDGAEPTDSLAHAPYRASEPS
jgi:SEC-C motif